MCCPGAHNNLVSKPGTPKQAIQPESTFLTTTHCLPSTIREKNRHPKLYGNSHLVKKAFLLRKTEILFDKRQPPTCYSVCVVCINSGEKNKARPSATAKSLQSCPTLCDPIDGSPPGSPVPGILQARTPEWVAISFSSAWKWKVKVKSLSCVGLLRPHGLQPTRFLHP